MTRFSNFRRSAVSILALGSTLLIGLTGCQDEDFGYSADNIKFARNFEATYGAISPDQEWDFSSSSGWTDPSFNLITRTTADVPTQTLTKSTDNSGHFSTKDGYWEVPSSLLTWLNTYLIEGHDNRYLGSHFILQMPQNDFAIIPIYQGASAIMSELEMKVNDYAITKIWTKSDDMQVKDTESSNWTDLGYFDGRSKYDVYETAGAKHAAATLGVARLQSKPIYFRHSKIGDNKYMYLSLRNIAKIRWGDGADDIWDKNNEWTTIGHRLTSINSLGHMLALNIPWNERPALSSLPNISEEGKSPSEMLIVGCEDAEGAGTDHDVNDVVFMIIGYPNAPKVIPATEVIKKRYMCEDLGATDDFDFNDIVVDVTQTMDYTLTTNPDEDKDRYDATSVEIVGMSAIESTKKQTAKISHVCGTLPFQVKVGNYTFPKVTDPENKYSTRRELWAAAGTRATEVTGNGWNPNEMKTITGWDPKANNIQIFVSGWKGATGDKVNNVFDGNSTTDEFADFSTGTYKVVEFSRPGTVPYIIATDQDVPWMSERADIPEEWLVGDMTARTNKKGESTADAGSSLYYTSSTGNSNGYEDEAVIWTGSVTGSKDVGGLLLAQGSSEHQAINDAMIAKYNVINIYAIKKEGGKFGLKLGDGTKRKLDVPDGSRDINTGEDADYFYQPNGTVNQVCKTSIVLTDRELTMIGIRGLFVSLGLDGMEIKEITMSRGARVSETNLKTADFYDVYLSAPTGGIISASDRERQNMKMGVDENTGKAIYEEDGSDRLRVPFTHSRYLNDAAQGTQSVTLTAVADEGYRFVKWSDDNTNISRTLPTNANTGSLSTPLTAIFEKLYRVHFVPQEDLGTSDYGYSLSGKCRLSITRGSESPVMDEIYAAVGDVLSLTPVPCDGYEFVQWWSDYSTIPRSYTVEAPKGGGTDIPVYGVFKKTPSMVATMNVPTTEDLQGYSRTDSEGNTIFFIDNKYCPNWTCVHSSDIDYSFANELNAGRKLLFILDFSDHGYSPYTAYLSAKAYNQNGVSTTVYSFTLQSGNDIFGENCTFENNKLYFVMTKQQFDNHFMQVIAGNRTVLSNMYFGFWNFLPKSIEVRAIK